MDKTAVYLEIGAKRALAGALDWPGWCRNARTEEEALRALLEVAPRYADIVARANLPFDPPRALADLIIAHRLPGNASTDFGALGVMPPGDAEPMNAADLARATSLLNACWAAFDATVEAARGKALTKGPRGGGRELEAIQRHTLDSETSYAARIGLKLGPVGALDPGAIAARREALLESMASIAELGTPPPGPRGGARWSARYLTRVVAYHIVDHIWEIEDRARPAG